MTINGNVLSRNRMRATVVGSVMALCVGAAVAQTGSNQAGSNQMPTQTTPGPVGTGQTGTAQTDASPMQGMHPESKGEMGMNSAGMKSGPMADKMFLHKAVEGNMAEIKLGQLAADKGDSQAVKDFGQKMVTDHTMLGEKMQPFLQSMGVMAPTKLNKKPEMEMDKLQGLSGSAFDKEYVSYMLTDHRMDQKAFKAEMESTTNPALKAAVTSGEEVIHGHLIMVEKLAKDMATETTASN